MVNAHIALNGLPYMLDNRGASYGQNSNPFAPRVAGGEDYKDFSTWSMWVMSSWATGVGKSDPEAGGYLYGEGIDSRYPSILMLSPRVTYSTAEAGAHTEGHFTEAIDGVLYMSLGTKLYALDNSATTMAWTEVYEATEVITSVSSFNGFVHMGQGDDTEYVWYDPATTNDGTGLVKARLLKEIGGFLYAAYDNKLSYTGGPSAGLTMSTPDGGDWVWVNAINIGGSEGHITGIAGTINSTFNDQSIYVSTDRALFLLLAFDVPMQLTRWYTADPHNGTVMSVYHNDVYMSEGTGLLRMTQDGSIVSTGLDLGIGLACNVAGQHGPSIPTNNYMLSSVNPTAGSPTVWAWGGEGWSFIGKFSDGTTVLDMSYDLESGNLLVLLSNGTVAQLFYLDSMAMYRREDAVRYVSSGFIDTGSVFGGVREVEKDFHSLYFHGCIFPGTLVDVYYSNETFEAECQECYNTGDVTWTYIGRFTDNNQELFFPPTVAAGRPVAKSIRFRLELVTSDPTTTPIVNAIRLKYIPKLDNVWSFRIGLTLPSDCMNDMEGVEIPGYTQAEWDTALQCATSAAAPMSFTNVDGQEYYVAVTDFRRTITEVRCDKNGSRKFDVHWTIGLLQVLPNTIGEAVSCG